MVVFGGSYSGNLAAWMRQLYPDLVKVAVASSAPVEARFEFSGIYLDEFIWAFVLNVILFYRIFSHYC